jgi:hypothetical protein
MREVTQTEIEYDSRISLPVEYNSYLLFRIDCFIVLEPN